MQRKCILAHWSCHQCQIFTKQIQDMQIYIHWEKSSAVAIYKSIFFDDTSIYKYTECLKNLTYSYFKNAIHMNGLLSSSNSELSQNNN